MNNFFLLMGSSEFGPCVGFFSSYALTNFHKRSKSRTSIDWGISVTGKIDMNWHALVLVHIFFLGTDWSVSLRHKCAMLHAVVVVCGLGWIHFCTAPIGLDLWHIPQLILNRVSWPHLLIPHKSSYLLYSHQWNFLFYWFLIDCTRVFAGGWHWRLRRLKVNSR